MTTTSDTRFLSGGEAVAATLYRPELGSNERACIVMGHGFTLTRRDGIPEYGHCLAAAGFTVLAFDYRHWGESAGEPRRWVSIAKQLADWRAAVAHARTIQAVDPDRVVAWGMSMGGGHALLTAAGDPRIAAVLGLMPTMDKLVAYPRSLIGARMFVYAIAETISGRPFRIAAAGPAGAFAVATSPEALPGFLEVTADSEWLNEVNTSWLLSALRWHPARHASRVRVPILLQLGERDRAVSGAAVEEAARHAPRAELMRYDVNHFGCFSSNHVGQIVSDQISFLRRHLPGARR